MNQNNEQYWNQLVVALAVERDQQKLLAICDEINRVADEPGELPEDREHPPFHKLV